MLHAVAMGQITGRTHAAMQLKNETNNEQKSKVIYQLSQHNNSTHFKN